MDDSTPRPSETIRPVTSPQIQASGENKREIDPVKLKLLAQDIKENQNFTLALVGGALAAAVSALLWAAITVVLDRQIGWMSLGVGFIVGLAVRKFGKGVDRVFGFAGSVLSLAGCMAGNLIAYLVIIAQHESVSILAILAVFLTVPETILEFVQATFDPMDLVFYGIALYEGYRFSFRNFTAAELAGVMKR